MGNGREEGVFHLVQHLELVEGLLQVCSPLLDPFLKILIQSSDLLLGLFALVDFVLEFGASDLHEFLEVFLVLSQRLLCPLAVGNISKGPDTGTHDTVPDQGA